MANSGSIAQAEFDSDSKLELVAAALPTRLPVPINNTANAQCGEAGSPARRNWNRRVFPPAASLGPPEERNTCFENQRGTLAEHLKGNAYLPALDGTTVEQLGPNSKQHRATKYKKRQGETAPYG